MITEELLSVPRIGKYDGVSYMMPQCPAPDVVVNRIRRGKLTTPSTTSNDQMSFNDQTFTMSSEKDRMLTMYQTDQTSATSNAQMSSSAAVPDDGEADCSTEGSISKQCCAV